MGFQLIPGFLTYTWGVRTRSRVLTRSVMGPAGRLPMIELYPILARTQPTVRNTTGVKRMSYNQRFPPTFDTYQELV